MKDMALSWKALFVSSWNATVNATTCIYTGCCADEWHMSQPAEDRPGA